MRLLYVIDITMKICTKCKTELPKTTEYFGILRLSKDGLRSMCKKCRREDSAKWRLNNLESTRKSGREWYRRNAEEANRNRREKLEYLKENNPEEYRKYLDRKNESGKKHYHERGDEGRKIRNAKRPENLETLRAQGRKAAKKRMEDPKFRASAATSRLIRRALNGKKNGWHWEALTGYTRADLVRHLEKQFTEGMSWDNYGEWQIDHRVPISVFNFTSPEHEDFKRCWALKNLQPMWASENKSKSAKLEKHFQPRLALGVAC